MSKKTINYKLYVKLTKCNELKKEKNNGIMAVNLFGSLVVKRSLSDFVPRFKFPKYNIPLSDFKGHQVKALQKFQYLAPQLSMVLELRDIRAPLSTRNILFDKFFLSRSKQIKRLIVYTKKDYMPQNNVLMKNLLRWHKELDEDFIIVDGKSRTDVNNLMKVLNWESNKLLESNIPLPMGYRILVTGMPNVGKSTLVNTLRQINYGKRSDNSRRTKVSKTGNEAGVTRKTSEVIRISKEESQQCIYLIDSPGIGIPGRVSDQSRMISQALCGCVKETLIDPIAQADYLLFLMNLQELKNGIEWYPDCKSRPSNDIYNVLNRKYNLKRIGETSAAIAWINQWKRDGKNISFDVETLLGEDTFSYKKYLIEDLKRLGDFELNNNKTDISGSAKQLFV